MHIISTCILSFCQEKWDSMTRRWRDNTFIVQSICLFLIDEVHVYCIDKNILVPCIATYSDISWTLIIPQLYNYCIIFNFMQSIQIRDLPPD